MYGLILYILFIAAGYSFTNEEYIFVFRQTLVSVLLIYTCFIKEIMYLVCVIGVWTYKR